MSTIAETRTRGKRRTFTEEFKQQAARLVLDEGKTMAEVCRELDLVPTAFREWVERARADRNGGKTGLTTAEREELTRLRRQVRILEEEREILKLSGAAVAALPAGPETLSAATLRSSRGEWPFAFW